MAGPTVITAAISTPRADAGNDPISVRSGDLVLITH